MQTYRLTSLMCRPSGLLPVWAQSTSASTTTTSTAAVQTGRASKISVRHARLPCCVASSGDRYRCSNLATRCLSTQADSGKDSINSSTRIGKSTTADNTHSTPVALVMGVANARSIAWACVNALLDSHPTLECIVTFHNHRVYKTVHRLCETHPQSHRILCALPCNVEDESALPRLFGEDLAGYMTDGRHLQSVVHSVAYANLQSSPSLLQSSLRDYMQAQQISAYSFVQTAQCAMPLLLQSRQQQQQQQQQHMLQQSETASGRGRKDDNRALNDATDAINNATDNKNARADKELHQVPSSPLPQSTPSLTTLSFIGSHRYMPGYSIMAPCKASLESMVYTLAHECAPVRVNAVSAGPIQTLSARGIADFGRLQGQLVESTPLRRAVTSGEVADMAAYVSLRGSGMTGQVVYVDGGYSSGSGCSTGIGTADDR
jgi:enoyl-[acyl-carrier-protein] reductase (NADH)